MLKVFRIFAMLVLLIASSECFSQQPSAQNQPAAQESQRLTDSKKDTDTPKSDARRPSAFDFFNSKGLQNISAYCAAKPDSEPDKWLHEKFICDVHVTDVIVAIFTALLVFVTIPLTLIGIWQGWLTRSTARRQLRAYLSFAGTFIENYGTKKRITINYKIKNHGQTPAFKINYRFSIDVIATHAVSEFEASLPERELRSDSTVFPDDTIVGWFHHSAILTQEQFTEIENDRAVIYCWGVMTYRDAFRKHRETLFSTYVGGPNFITTQKKIRAGENNPGPGYIWEFGKNHNRAS